MYRMNCPLLSFEKLAKAGLKGQGNHDLSQISHPVLASGERSAAISQQPSPPSHHGIFPAQISIGWQKDGQKLPLDLPLGDFGK